MRQRPVSFAITDSVNFITSTRWHEDHGDVSIHSQRASPKAQLDYKFLGKVKKLKHPGSVLLSLGYYHAFPNDSRCGQ